MYGIELYSQYKAPVATISTYTKLECARALNSAGHFNLTLPLSDFKNLFFWKPDMIFKFYRNVGMNRYLVGNTLWFLENIEINFENQEIILSGHDTVGLLERYLCAYTRGTDYAEKTIEFGLSDYASNLIKQFLRENIGSDAFDTDRDLSAHITITDDNDLGAVAEKDGSFQTLLSICSSLADQSNQAGYPIYFDLIPNSENHLTFYVFSDQLGLDKSVTNPIIFSNYLNNLQDVTMTRITEDTVTVAYVGGDGENEARLIGVAENEDAIIRSPFGRREKFFEEKEIDNESLINKRAKELLQKNSQKFILSGQVVDLPHQRFGVHYSFGDKVLINLNGYIGQGLVSAFSVDSSADGDKLEVRLRGEVIIP